MTGVFVIVVVFTIAALTTVPLVVLALIHANSLLESLARTRRRLRREREVVHPVPIGPPLEKIATDLRRIGAARRDTALGSLGYTILTRQFDKQLVHACRALSLEHRLDELCGLDLDIERLRVEKALSETGLVMTDSDVEQDIDG